MLSLSPLLLIACVRNEVPEPRKPRIGLTGATPALLEAIDEAGGTPVRLDPDAFPGMEGLDAVVLGPGADVDPARFGMPAHPTERRIDPAREALDLDVARYALRHDLPTLGVCLGAQELIIAAGGGLVQDLPSQWPEAVEHRSPHAVQWTGPFAALDLPSEVASNHHQAADALPAGFTSGGEAPDGVIEAFYAPGHRFVWGVQFHPETDPRAPAVFTALMAAAAQDAPGDTHEPGSTPWFPTCRRVHTPFDEPDRTLVETFEARVTSKFGDPRVSYVAGHLHGGSDLRTTPGDAVFAICPGEVVDIHLAFPHTTVVVRHQMPDGAEVYSSYKHVVDLDVAVGDRVHEASRIGRVFDAEEQRTAPWRANHLHFEMRHDITDRGAASWTSMDRAALERFALDPQAFTARWMDPGPADAEGP